MLVRKGSIETWSSGHVGPGEDWRKGVEEHLDSASVIVLLLSADFLRLLDQCYDVEVDRALSRGRTAKARVIPVRVRPYDCRGHAGTLRGISARCPPAGSP